MLTAHLRRQSVDAIARSDRARIAKTTPRRNGSYGRDLRPGKGTVRATSRREYSTDSDMDSHGSRLLHLFVCRTADTRNSRAK